MPSNPSLAHRGVVSLPLLASLTIASRISTRLAVSSSHEWLYVDNSKQKPAHGRNNYFEWRREGVVAAGNYIVAVFLGFNG